MRIEGCVHDLSAYSTLYVVPPDGALQRRPEVACGICGAVAKGYPRPCCEQARGHVLSVDFATRSVELVTPDNRSIEGELTQPRPHRFKGLRFCPWCGVPFHLAD